MVDWVILIGGLVLIAVVIALAIFIVKRKKTPKERLDSLSMRFSINPEF